MSAMWHPEPGWQPLPAGLGASTTGVWLAGGEVVKRIGAPAPGDAAELTEPGHFAYWHRPADVATSGAVLATPGLRGPPTRVEEDTEGVTLWTPHLDTVTPSGLFAARCLGAFAGADLPAYDWLARDQLADRVLRVERRGGWPTLARTSLADVADRLWSSRWTHLDALAGLPQVPQHGDPTPQNLLCRDLDGVQAIDWATLGLGPVGADLGYYSLAAAEEFEPLLTAYAGALPAGLASLDQVALGAQVSAVYTALSRAEWALAQADHPTSLTGGHTSHPGHPAVTPYLRSLQRQLPQIEALLA